ncbi:MULTISPECIES: C40 family peptidase [unclassified Corallococcus]|uniref:C40 family peptidase n=1 Tax=unclassified Corallococcus TaxID=2685029 RepID=UPI001A8FE54A|nr:MULTISPECIES: CHAP domain-containing protein [unclassified Corallococcus]MBN9684686.1 CHAP domain-containing protein [Corallococcus sp. NCSPR001]WAS83842.1 CHAP domain-containing protein [Corallococcus sp. NCRR]
MKLGAWMAMLAMTTGCATGSPTGAWVASDAVRYRSASPPAFPRAALSEEVAVRESAPAKRPAKAPAPSKSPAVAKAPAKARPKPRVTPAKQTAARPAPPANPRERVLDTARALVGQSTVQVNGKRYPADCTALIEATYAQAGVKFRGTLKPGDNGVTAMYRYAQANGRVYTSGRPVPGDLVFFRETYDQNRDGRRNDGLTHVGLVDGVDSDGTVTVIHRVKRGVARYRMNLARPHMARDPKTGEILNDMLRSPAPGQPHVLTGQLFAAFGSVLPSGPAKPMAVAAR